MRRWRCSSTDVKTAVQAAIVTLNVTLRFEQLETDEKKRQFYVTNPANTVAFSAMVALEERAVVRIAEAFGRDAGLLPEGTGIRAKADLVCHRHSLSHGYTVRWKSPAMQPFADANRQFTDRRAAIVWDAWRSLNDELAKHGKPKRDMAVAIGWEHAALVRHILRASVKPEFLPHMPTEESILEHLQKFRDDFLDLLVEKPDGRSHEHEQRALARREELRQRWSKSD